MGSRKKTTTFVVVYFWWTLLGTVYSHVRFHSMGPFHYVRLERRKACSRQLAFRTLLRVLVRLVHTIKNDHKCGRLFLVDAQGLEPWTH